MEGINMDDYEAIFDMLQKELEEGVENS